MVGPLGSRREGKGFLTEWFTYKNVFRIDLLLCTTGKINVLGREKVSKKLL